VKRWSLNQQTEKAQQERHIVNYEKGRRRDDRIGRRKMRGERKRRQRRKEAKEGDETTKRGCTRSS